jgi:acyl carrier protein
MTSSTTFEQLRGIASDIFGVPAVEITESSSPETIESWDSVQHLNLVLAMEEQFAVQFDPEEMDQMKNMGEIAGLLDKKQRG